MNWSTTLNERERGTPNLRFIRIIVRGYEYARTYKDPNARADAGGPYRKFMVHRTGNRERH